MVTIWLWWVLGIMCKIFLKVNERMSVSVCIIEKESTLNCTPLVQWKYENLVGICICTGKWKFSNLLLFYIIIQDSCSNNTEYKKKKKNSKNKPVQLSVLWYYYQLCDTSCVSAIKLVRCTSDCPFTPFMRLIAVSRHVSTRHVVI